MNAFGLRDNGDRELALRCAILASHLAGLARPELTVKTAALWKTTLQALEVLVEHDLNEPGEPDGESDGQPVRHGPDPARIEVAEELVLIDERIHVALAAMESPAADDASNGLLAISVVRWLDDRLGPLMGTAGVSTFEDTGPYDPSRHEVVQSRPAPDPRLVDTIAESVRPGLLLDDELLRPQLVVTYTEGPVT
jgi:hypothetical protein